MTLEISRIEFDGATIRSSSRATLDEIARVLQDPAMQSSIVDRRDGAPARERSEAIVAYLVRKNVPASRVRVMDATPLGRAASPDAAGEATEFRVLGR